MDTIWSLIPAKQILQNKRFALFERAIDKMIHNAKIHNPIENYDLEKYHILLL